MLCTECQTENPDDKQHCGQCGAELIVSFASDTEAQPKTEVEEQPSTMVVVPPRQTFPITISINGATDRGLVRERNEDTFAWYSYKFPNHPIEIVVAVVADGMGGGQQGDVMSHLATTVTVGYVSYMLGMLPPENSAASVHADELFQTLNEAVPDIIYNGVQHANEKIREHAKTRGFERGDYGATIVVTACVARCDTGEISIHGWNEGDARASFYNGGALTQLTRDHARGDQITKCLGLSQKISGDSFSKNFLVSKPACVMAYTDGLYKMVDPNPNLTVLKNIELAKTVETPAMNLVDTKAQAESGDDNITLVKIEFMPVVVEESTLIITDEAESEEILDLVTTTDSKQPPETETENESQEILNIVTEPETKKSKWWDPSRFLKLKQGD